MTDKKISAFAIKTLPIAADFIPIVDSQDANPATQNKKITVGSLPTVILRIAAADAENGQLFIDIADGILKFKDLSASVYELYGSRVLIS
jgi:hypothetical protein